MTSKSHELNEEQKSFLEKNFSKLKEQELFQKVSELGPADEKSFADSIRNIAAKIETGVFGQKVSEDELASIGGGLCGANGSVCKSNADENCDHNYNRHIYNGGFPNCASTVEDSSWCSSNDACYFDDVRYQDMKDCHKAHR